MYKEYIILSRGGQGGVTASRILASAAVYEGRWAQAIPEFGAERRGAIVKSYLRVSDGIIKRHSKIYKADGLSIFSSKILSLIDIKREIPNDLTLIVNSPYKPNLEGFKEIYYVDATSIALKHDLVLAGWPIVNTAMASAMAKVFDIASIDNIVKAIEEYFRGEIAIKNISAAIEAWDMVAR